MKDTAEDTRVIQRKTPYDDVFRTMMEQCTQLIIPVINEVFHETYGMDEPIELRANEQLCKKTNGEWTKRVTDAYIIIKGSQYHIECQLNKDSNMAVRMLEYDFYIALTQIQKKNGRLTAEFPKSVVLQLRNQGTIPECYEISVKMQENNHAMYRVPVVKVQDYSRQELFDKQDRKSVV